jgi:DNA replication and repair protein RecF
MSIKKLEIECFRNHDKRSFTFTDGINIIFGKNGSGKTSILEAIHLLSLGKSFRTPNRRLLIQNGRTQFTTKAVFEKTHVKKIEWRQNIKGEKKIKADENPVSKIKTLVGKNPTVVLSPDEPVVTKGSPSQRRKYFDKVFCTGSKTYLTILEQFNRALKQRNAGIISHYEGKPYSVSVEPWNETYVQSSFQLWEERKTMFKLYNSLFKKPLNREKAHRAECVYSVSFPDDKDKFRVKIETEKRRELIYKRTLSGPHQDKININYKGEDIRNHGSQGEHKWTLVLLKKAEFSLFKHSNHTKPFFLLDDLFSELDRSRSNDVLSLLRGGTQALITTTDVGHLKEFGITDFSSINMSN